MVLATLPAATIHRIIAIDHIPFFSHAELSEPVHEIHMASDASEYRIEAVTTGPSIKDIGHITISLPQKKPILQNELDAAFLGMALGYNNSKINHRIQLQLFFGNNAVISFISRGRAKWSWSFFAHARALFRLHMLRRLFYRLAPSYVPSKGNPADAPSRAQASIPDTGQGRLTDNLKIYFSILLELSSCENFFVFILV